MEDMVPFLPKTCNKVRLDWNRPLWPAVTKTLLLLLLLLCAAFISLVNVVHRGLRITRPSSYCGAAFYSAAPLTSAGIIPIMQSLCPDGQRDEFGFLQYQNST